jgi:hypothetical protein
MRSVCSYCQSSTQIGMRWQSLEKIPNINVHKIRSVVHELLRTDRQTGMAKGKHPKEPQNSRVRNNSNQHPFRFHNCSTAYSTTICEYEINTFKPSGSVCTACFNLLKLLHFALRVYLGISNGFHNKRRFLSQNSITGFSL